jgi:hypothetical protein
VRTAVGAGQPDRVQPTTNAPPGGLAATAAVAPYAFTLNLTPGPGRHTLIARAFDAAGNTTDSAPITIGP